MSHNFSRSFEGHHFYIHKPQKYSIAEIVSAVSDAYGAKTKMQQRTNDFGGIILESNRLFPILTNSFPKFLENTSTNF